MTGTFQLSGGWIEVVAGVMFSGKSEELMRRVRRAMIARKRVQVFKSHLDARYAGARGFIDAIVYPEDTRDVLSMALRAALQNPGPHIGPFHLPAGTGDA